jgi:hypothetical protein
VALPEVEDELLLPGDVLAGQADVEDGGHSGAPGVKVTSPAAAAMRLATVVPVRRTALGPNWAGRCDRCGASAARIMMMACVAPRRDRQPDQGRRFSP